MFYQELEALASKEPSLKHVLEKLDNLFKEKGASGVYDPVDVAGLLNTKLSQVKGIFMKLVRIGLLNEEEFCPCPECGTLIDPQRIYDEIRERNTYNCEDCGYKFSEIDKHNKVIKYRLKAKEINVRKYQRKKVFPRPNFEKEIPERYLAEPFKYTGLLNYYSHKFEEKQPLAGKRIYFILHFLGDIIPFIVAMKRLGLDLKNCVFFYKDYPYPQKEAIKNWIEEQGAIIAHMCEVEPYIKQLTETNKQDKNLLILEDGGFIVPLIHRKYPDLVEQTIGAVEQTSRGIWNTQEWLNESKGNELGFPVVSVAGSKLKQKFEPKYIGEAAVKNLEKMIPNISFRGKKAVVFGFGAIGKEVANWLQNKGAIVIISDIKSDKKLEASENGYEVADSPTTAVRDAFLVIGASGRQSIDSSVISTLKHGCYIASASSEQYEIDINELIYRSLGKEILKDDNGIIIGTTFALQAPPNEKKINLIANGYPINFWGLESMPEQASDLILSLILLSAVELSLGNINENKIHSDKVNKLTEKYEISKEYLESHKN